MKTNESTTKSQEKKGKSWKSFLKDCSLGKGKEQFAPTDKNPVRARYRMGCGK